MADEIRPGAVLFAKDAERVARFYGELADGARVRTAEGCFLVRLGGFELVVHPVPEAIARSIRIDSPPERREDACHKLVFPVTSLARTRAAAPALGGVVDPVSREWSARGFRACDGHDPEGNVVQFREPLAASTSGA